VVSPCRDLREATIIGEMDRSRDRTLDHDEIFAYWRAARRLPYPYGAVYRVLILSALRLNEVADASWPEFNLPDRMWTVPAERMKGKNAGKRKARAHPVPLTDDLLALFDALPRLNGGPFLFSTTNGRTAVWMGSKAKKRLDARMRLTLKAIARVRGYDPRNIALRPFKIHDIRRTVRTQLSRLKVAEEVREALLAHVRPGIVKVYDVHDYVPEKAEALNLWAARLWQIVNRPIRPHDNVVRVHAVA
jgi:integrase